MNTIFEYENYKKFVIDRLNSYPKRGFGQWSKIAEHLATGSVNVSQIFSGKRDLTSEQALLLTDFFGLNVLETEYFVSLVDRERAGTKRLKDLISIRIKSIHVKAQNLKDRIPQERDLSEIEKSTLYSNWYYTAIFVLTSIEGFNSLEVISQKLKVPIKIVREALDFLIYTGLVVEKNGKYSMGPKSTHLEASSPLVSRHHTNWRLKGIESMVDVKPHELFLTLPCSVSEKDLKIIRTEMVKHIEKLTKTIDESPAEKFVCINIDFFEI